MASLTPAPKFTALDSNGDPRVGAQLYTYEAGTVTLKTSWVDSGETIPNPNPIILDSYGQADVWLGDGAYRLQLLDPDGNMIWDVDDIRSLADLAEAVAKGSWYADTVTDLVALEGDSDGRALLLAGYHSKGDGGGGQFYWDSTSTDTGDDGVTFAVSGVATGRWKRVYFGVINAKWFGAKGDGATNDHTALQAVVDFAYSSGVRNVKVPDGIYALGSMLDIKGITFRGTGNGTGNTSSAPSTGSCVFKSIGASTVIRLRDTTNTIVKNADIGSFSIDCNGTATRAFHASTCYNSRISDIVAKNATGTDFVFKFDDANGNLFLKNIIENLSYNSTAAAGAVNSGGFKFSSEAGGAAGGCVQNKVRNCSSFTQDGPGFLINGSDNNVFESIQAFATGTGGKCYLNNDGAGPTAARNNQFIVPVCGFVAAEGTWGNEIFTGSSEAVPISTHTDSSLHYSIFDYTEGSKYTTHHYKVTDYYGFTPGDMLPTGAATRGLALFLWDSIELPESAAGGVAFNLPIQYGWKNGKITRIELTFISDGANTSDQVYLRLRARIMPDNSAASTPGVDRYFSVDVNDAANRITVVTEDLGVDSISLGTGTDLGVVFRLDRDPAHANDTCTSNLHLTSIRVFFQFDGPINGGDVDVPNTYKTW